MKEPAMALEARAAIAQQSTGMHMQRAPLPPTEMRNGKRVIVKTRQAIVTQERLIEVVEIPRAFIDELTRLERVKESWRVISVVGSLLVGLFFGVLVALVAYVVVQNMAAAFVAGGLVYIVATLGLSSFIELRKINSTKGSIGDLYKKYGLEPNVGKVYTGPESYRYSDVVYIAKD